MFEFDLNLLTSKTLNFSKQITYTLEEDFAKIHLPD